MREQQEQQQRQQAASNHNPGNGRVVEETAESTSTGG